MRGGGVARTLGAETERSLTTTPSRWTAPRPGGVRSGGCRPLIL